MCAYLQDGVQVKRVQHAPLPRGDDHSAVPARCLQVGVERVFGPVHREQTVHQVALNLSQAVLGCQQALYIFLYPVPAEAGAQQDGQEHRCRGEEHRVSGHEAAQCVEGAPQAGVQHLAQHPGASPSGREAPGHCRASGCAGRIGGLRGGRVRPPEREVTNPAPLTGATPSLELAHPLERQGTDMEEKVHEIRSFTARRRVREVGDVVRRCTHR